MIRKKVRYDIAREVLECIHCGFIFLRPRSGNVSRFYSGRKYRCSYGPVINKSSSPKEIFDTYYPFQKDIIQEIEPLLRKDMKVLDVGCSTGHFLASLKGMVGLRVGVELSRDEADFANKNLGFKVYTKPIEELELQEGPFDLITALQVLEHVDDPLAFLRNLKKHLKPNGFLYLELPNINDPLLWYYESTGYADFYFREPHLSYFSARTLKRLLERAGFRGRIKTVQRYNFLNHLHWRFANAPQGSFGVGNSAPLLTTAKNRHVVARTKDALNDFIKRVDRQYKKLIVAHGLGESLTFLGKK